MRSTSIHLSFQQHLSQNIKTPRDFVPHIIVLLANVFHMLKMPYIIQLRCCNNAFISDISFTSDIEQALFCTSVQ